MSSIGRPRATIDLNTPTVSAVSSLNERVEIIEGNLTTNTANISTNTLNIDTIHTKIGDNESDPKTGLYLDIATNKTDISTLNTKIGDNESDPKTGIYLDIETINTKIGDNEEDPKTGIFLKLQNLQEGHEIIPNYDYTGVYLILLKDLIDTDQDPNIIINNSTNKHLNDILMEIEKKIAILEKNNDLTRSMLTMTGYGLGSTAIRSMATAPILFNSRSLDAIGINESTIPTFSLINLSQSSIDSFAIEISNWIYSVIPKPIMDVLELATGKTQQEFIQDIIQAQNPQKFLEMEFLSRVKIGVNGDLYLKPADSLHPKGIAELAFSYLNASEIITKANKLANIHSIGTGLNLSALHDLSVDLKSSGGLELSGNQIELTYPIFGIGGAIAMDENNHIHVNADQLTLSVNPETKQIAIATTFIEEREAEIDGIEAEIAGIYDALGLEAAGEGASSFWNFLTGGGAILAGLSGVGGAVSISTAIGVVDTKVENLEYLKDILVEGTGSLDNNAYFINSGNIGIAYTKNHDITEKLQVNGNIKCDNIKSTAFISPDGTEFYLQNTDKRVREEGETTTQISLTDDYYTKSQIDTNFALQTSINTFDKSYNSLTDTPDFTNNFIFGESFPQTTIPQTGELIDTTPFFRFQVSGDGVAGRGNIHNNAMVIRSDTTPFIMALNNNPTGDAVLNLQVNFDNFVPPTDYVEQQNAIGAQLGYRKGETVGEFSGLYFRNLNSPYNMFGGIFTFPNENEWTMVLHDNKNVGIGTVYPSEKLEVNGNIKCDKVYANSVIDDAGIELYIGNVPDDGNDGLTRRSLNDYVQSTSINNITFKPDGGSQTVVNILTAENNIVEIPRGLKGDDGSDGKGFTGGSYNANTGIITFSSTDGLGFTTSDLRGTDGNNGNGFTGGSYNANTGIITFSSTDGLGFTTSDLRGTDGNNGNGFTGGSYNAETGIITFTSDDDIGFQTDDLRTSIPSEYIKNIDGTITIKSGDSSGSIKIHCENDTNFIELKAPSQEDLTENITFTLPFNDGNANQVLKTDGSGNLGWIDQSSGGSSFFTESTDSAGDPKITYDYDIYCRNIYIGDDLYRFSLYTEIGSLWYNLGGMVSTIQDNNLKQLNNRALDISDNEILTFEHIPNEDSYEVEIKFRSKTSISNYWKTFEYYAHTTTPPLTNFDDPYPSCFYKFSGENISYWNSEVGLDGMMKTTKTFESGELQTPTNNSGDIQVSIWYYVLSGDIFRYTGLDDIWSIYYLNYNLSKHDLEKYNLDEAVLIKTFKDQDEYVFDSLKYKNKFVYLIKDNDVNQRIRILHKNPDVYIDQIRTGSHFTQTDNNNSYKYQTFISDTSRQIWYQLVTPERPSYLNEDEPLTQTPGGIPGNSDNFYNYSWYINYTPIATLYESGDLNITGSVYFDCKIGPASTLKPGKLLNSVSSIRNPNNTEIQGLPDLVDQVFELTLTTLDSTNNKSYWTGKDRNREYDNEQILTIELYYDDVLKINYGPGIYDFIINNSLMIYIDTPDGSLLTSGNVGPEGLLEQFIVKYPKPQNEQSYKLIGPETIDINLSDLTGYINPTEEPTTQYNLVYFPHSNEYRWLRNWFLQTGGTIQQPDDDELPPVIGPGYGGSVGTFSAKYTTQQISSRRTLNPSVGLEKIAQTTEYAVFNGETEFNNNVLLEQINNDIALYFTIYTNKNKKDPTTDEDNFKDKANIELVNDSNKWVFNRDCLNGNLETASTNFQHQGVDKLIITNTQIESTVDLKVSKIIFGDNSILLTAPTGGGSFDLTVRNDYPYIYTNTQVINQNNVDNGTFQFFELNSDASNPVYMNYLRHYPSNNVYNLPKNIIHFNTNYEDAGFWFGNSATQWKQWLHINDFALSTDRNIKLSKRATDTEDPKIIFHDGTSISTANIDYNNLTNTPSYLFAPTFLKVYFLMDYSAIMTQLQEPGAIAPYFNTTNIPINVGSFSVSNSGISVPANGYYHIDYCLLMRSRNNGSDRKNIITSIKVNNADPDGRLQGVGGSYMRYKANNNNCENAQAGNTMLYLTTTDVVSLWGYREGSTGDVFITRGGNMQVRRIA